MCRRGGRESPPGILGKVILVMSGPGRMMYQCLEPKPEGAIFRRGQSLRHCKALLTTHSQYRKLAGIEHTRQRNAGFLAVSGLGARP